MSRASFLLSDIDPARVAITRGDPASQDPPRRRPAPRRYRIRAGPLARANLQARAERDAAPEARSLDNRRVRRTEANPERTNELEGQTAKQFGAHHDPKHPKVGSKRAGPTDPP